MVWIRYGKIRAIWRCVTSRGYDTKYHAVGVSIRDEYAKKPEEDIENWANRLGDFVARRMCQNACGSLSTSVFCEESSVQSEIVYTSETLTITGIEKEEKVEVAPEEVAEEEKVEKVEVKPKVPSYILGQIELLEDRFKEAESVDEKIAIREEIDRLKERYGIH